MRLKRQNYNFSKKVKLDQLCEHDGVREVFEYIFFNENNAIATDGHVLIVVPIELISNLEQSDIEKLNGHLIHYSVFAKLRKMDALTEITETYIKAHNDVLHPIEVSFPIEINGVEGGCKYCDYKKIFYDIYHAKKQISDEICFDSERLNDLCAAVDQYKPIITPNGEHGAIKVRFKEVPYDRIQAAIMPCLFKD